jgi:aminomethyltransferase
MSDFASPLRAVPLASEHLRLGARMVPFAGYSLPLQYHAGIVAEHNWTRAHASLFDVSHMGPSFAVLSSPSGDAEADHAAIAALVEPFVSGDIRGLAAGQLRYTLLLNEEGGILDDLLVGRSPLFPGSLYIVVNAATKHSDWALLEEALGSAARLQCADDGALLALQGPDAAAVLSQHLPGCAELGFMRYAPFDWRGGRVIVSRSGYTGEDGFELLCEATVAGDLWNVILLDDRVRPAGLGARDSLRLEAGLPLYGHDLDGQVSPVEAALSFAVSRRRREAGDLRGNQRLAAELAGNLSRLRVGLRVEGAPAREGATIHDAGGTAIGVVTSGGFSPTCQSAIAMGYVPATMSQPGTRLQVAVRGRLQPAEVSSLPFIAHRYFRKTAP